MLDHDRLNTLKSDIRLSSFIPLGGLGLALSDPTSTGCTQAEVRRALLRNTKHPIGTCGDFSMPLDLGNLMSLEHALAQLEASDLGLTHFDVVAGSLSLELSPGSIPVILLPGLDQIVVAYEHVVSFVRGVASGAFGLQVTDRGLYVRRPRSIAYTPPKARGPVTMAEVERFAGGFPELCGPMADVIPWTSGRKGSYANAEEANLHVGRLLGFRVDIRVGGLVAGAAIEDAVDLAGGQVSHDDGARSQGDRLSEYVKHRVPIVHPETPVAAKNRIQGAAWSYDVDTALNAREAWTTVKDQDGRTVWLSDRFVEKARRSKWQNVTVAGRKTVFH